MNNTQWHFTAFLQCGLRFEHPFFIMRREMEREAKDLQTFGRWLRMKEVGPICRDIVFRSGLCSKRRSSPLTRPGIWWLLMCEHVLPLNLSKPHWSYSLWGTRMQEPYTHPPHAPLLSSSPLLFSLCGFPHFWQAVRRSSAVLQSFFQIYPQPQLSCAGYFRNPPSSAAVSRFSLNFSFCSSNFTSFCHISPSISLSLCVFSHSSSVQKPSELPRCLLRQHPNCNGIS